MKTEQKKVALIVHSCDRYEFLYKGFDYFFMKHWDLSIPCNYYFVTEEIDANIHGFKNIKSGKGEWSDRLLKILRDPIKEEYILYFQEDMWLTKNVNAKFFIQLFQQAIENNWKQVKLHSSEVYKTKATNIFIEGFNISEISNTESKFLMSHQVSLWKKDFLLDQLFKNENPWRNEKRGSTRLRKLNPKIMHADYFSENGKPEINKNREMNGRSEYQTISVNSILNKNIHSFIKKLKMGDIEQINYAGELQLHFDNNLTHDGKAKQRKEDVYKKLTKWLRKKNN